MSQQFLSKYFFSPAAGASSPDGGKGGSSKASETLTGSGSNSNSRSSPPSDAKTSPKARNPGGKSKSAAARGKRKALAVEKNDADKTITSTGWQCGQCTFQNFAGAATACDMCGRRRALSSAAKALGIVDREEIEICSSDGRVDDASSGGNKDDGDDSDFEEAPIGRDRKRAKKATSVDEPKPSPSRTQTESKKPPSGNRKERPTGRRSESDGSGGSPVRETPPSSRAVNVKAPLIEVDHVTQVLNPFSLSVAGRSSGGSAAAAGTAAAAEVVITADSFDLQENSGRREKFQAGVNATLRDGDQPRAGAGEGGGYGGADLGEGGASGPSPADESTSKASPSLGKVKVKGKGKGGAAGGVKLTPMEQQVFDLKAQHPGVLLLVECGYRYRFFGEDALVAAKVLRIYAHVDHNFQVASVPTFRLVVHLRRLVDAGHKVGVVRQAESAALKAAGLTETGKKSGTFKRELAAVFTQATWMEGAVEALIPSSTSSTATAAGGGATKGASGGGGNTGGNDGGKGSWRKIGGAWRRVGGWGKGVRGGEAGGADENGGGAKEKEGDPAVSEVDMDAPVPQIDHERSEQWLLSVYEEDASRDASDGEPLSISLALEEGTSAGSADEVDAVRVGVIAMDVRTGRVVHDAFVEGSGQRQELDTRLRHLRPLELLAPGPRLSKATEATLARYCDSAVDARGERRIVRTERLPPEEFCFDAAQTSLMEYYTKHMGKGRAATVAGACEKGDASALTRVLDLARPEICALGPLMTHLQRFGLDRALATPDLVSFSQSRYMTLDAVTLRDLEVLQCQADGREAGSLFSVLDRTQTAFGRRALAGWIRQPLLSPVDITARQDAVDELATDPPPVMERLRPTLRNLKDLDPAIASLHHRKIQPSRLLSLLGTMRKVFVVFHPPVGGAPSENARANGADPGILTPEEQGSAKSRVLLEAIAAVPANMAMAIGRFLGELNAEAAAADDYVRALVDGESLCKELAEAAGDEEAANAGLEKELHSIRTALRKPSLQWKTLRTGATSTVEYLVELRKSEAKKLAPASWMQVSQTKELARFHTPEVLRLQQDLLRARESRNIAARQAWAELVSQVDGECYKGFRNAVHALGTLDALFSLAAVAKLPGYVRPVYRHDSTVGSTGRAGVNSPGSGGGDARRGEQGTAVDAIVLRGARHPTVERVLEGGFVPNDVELRKGECLVVTGPNMGGKSTAVRMLALLCIMGQIGSHVPADSAEMYCLDGVYTRMGAGDDLAADMSTFMVELWHTSYILKHATPRSLVVLDELGRGTSTHDGVAIALATLRHMVRDLGCTTLFVTHYPQVADLASDKSLSGCVTNAHMSFIENSTTTADGQKARESDGGTGGGGGSGGEVHGVTFLYRLVVGQAHRSYGLNVARAAGMDEDMIELAAKKSGEMRDRSSKAGQATSSPPKECNSSVVR